MKTMIIVKDSGVNTHHLCPACPLFDYTKGADPHETIPMFYSERHAHDAGWRKTDDLMFCDPRQEYVWVCPDCWPGDAR
jgi:hypothetical protein